MEIKFTIKQVVAVRNWRCPLCHHRMINIPTLFQIQTSSFSMRYKRYFHYFWTDYRFACRVDWSCNQGLSAGYGLWWTWIIASGLFGLVVGPLENTFRSNTGCFELKDIVLLNLIQIVLQMLLFGASGTTWRCCDLS